MGTNQTINLLGLDREHAHKFFLEMGEKSYRTQQLLRWIHQRGVSDFAEMTDLSKALRQRLENRARIHPPEIVESQQAEDGTRKWLLRLNDGNCIEMVFIPEPDRGTLCISSQVGCVLNCSFCATARQGFNRNLNVDEIIGQLWVAQRDLAPASDSKRSITNIVMMGMGEPLLNLDNVISAIGIMLDDWAYGLSRRRITVSTAGVVPGIDRLHEELPVSLAVSLHAPEDSLRDQLVPLNKKYPIRQLLDACRRYTAGDNRRRITIEYIMINDFNDSSTHAKALARLLRDVPSKVNLIPFNPLTETVYQCSSQTRIDAFRNILLAEGLITVTRRTRGGDIDAACGQLAGRIQDRTHRSQQWQASNVSGFHA